jgi:hypothetical protein
MIRQHIVKIDALMIDWDDRFYFSMEYNDECTCYSEVRSLMFTKFNFPECLFILSFKIKERIKNI